jgi:GT2 family glycosyltransferase
VNELPLPAHGSAELLATYLRVRLVRNGRDVGFAAAVNQAHRLATGRLVLLLNSDVRFHPGALSAMVRFLADRPDAAGVSSFHLNPDGSFQQHYVQLPSFPAAVALVTSWRRTPWFRGALRTFQLRGQDFSRPRPLASGSCMLLRREALGPLPVPQLTSSPTDRR